ncbi:MAG: hypothetical protein KAJ49_03865 [Arcobacteraceae bacterium]|nr:hypothetical protein [Arcobacteraceae bacterium]
MSIKRIFFILPFVYIFILTGCGDKVEEDKKQDNVNVTTTPKIEVVQNKNAREIKVEEKGGKSKISSTKGKAYYYDYDINSEYDPKSQPANKDAAVRIKPRTVLDANMNIRSPYERVQVSLILKQLSSQFKLKCSACHDDYANGVIGPSLLGKDSTYIYNKIAEFKTGKQSNPLMDDLIKMMSDDEIKRISEEIYEFNKRIQNIRTKK